ncbi:MAG: AMP-binding protein [Candidatus Woesearchaeota archaeon]
MFLRKLIYLRQALRNQWLSEERLQRLQTALIRNIVKFHYENNRFYRQLLKKHGLKSYEAKHLDDIRKLPIITKEDLRNSRMGVLSDGYSKKNTIKLWTSGSSGAPLEVFHDRNEWDYLDAVYARTVFNAGYKPWMKMAYYWSYDEVLNKKAFYERIGLMRKEYVVATLPIIEQYKRIMRIKPHAITCFPSSLSLVCRQMVEKNLPVPKIRLILSHAEFLHENARRFIEQVLNAPVFNLYGSLEFMKLAGECNKREGMHINGDSVYIELVDNDNQPVAPGERGELVVTGMHNRAMPFLRYKVGDTGVFSTERCSCKRSLPLLESLEGRDDEFITLPNGSIIGPRAITGVLDNEILFNDKVSNFRVIQTGLRSIEVQVIPGRNFQSDTEEVIKQQLKKLSGEEMNIRIKNVKKLDANRRGKFRFVINNFLKKR